MAPHEELSASLKAYLEAIFHICSQKGEARSKDIMEMLNVTGPSVTEALQLLAKKNLINYLPYQTITISHELPQRIRLRSYMLKNRDLDPDYFEASIESIPGVTGVRLNTRAACVIVRYDGLNKTRTAVLSRFNRLPREVFTGTGCTNCIPSRS